jgi:streptogramin lyase
MQARGTALIVFATAFVACRITDVTFMQGSGSDGSDGSDGSGGSDGSDGSGVVVGPPLVLQLLAGTIGGSGNLDGIGFEARFDQISHLALGSGGRVFVADEVNDAIRVVTGTGVVTTLATGTNGTFQKPSGITVGTDGTVYVSDLATNGIWKVGSNAVTPLALTGATLSHPTDLAIGSDNTIFVADTGSHRVMQITASGACSPLAGGSGLTGTTNASGSAARFGADLDGIAVDNGGNVFVSDTDNNTVRQIVISSGMVTTLTGIAGSPGSTMGALGTAKLDTPMGLVYSSSFSGDPHLFIADPGSAILRSYNFNGGNLGNIHQQLGPIAAVALDGSGAAGSAFYLADGNTIETVIGTTVATFAGSAAQADLVDDTGSVARFDAPTAIATDGSGIYVADSGNNVVRTMTAAGAVSTLALTPPLTLPEGLVVDGSGGFYAADAHPTVPKIFHVVPPTATRFAGGAGVGNANGDAMSATFDAPHGLALDSGGVLYVADTGNDQIRTVVGGQVSRYAVTGFSAPRDVAVDGSGNVYVADTGNHVIVRLTTDPLSSPRVEVAGTASELVAPTALVADAVGNVYIADRGAIWKIQTDGTIVRIAGVPDQLGVRTGNDARFFSPQGLAILGHDLLVTDANAVLLLKDALSQ